MTGCEQGHDPTIPYDPGRHSDMCLARVMGPVYRAMKGQLIAGGDRRVWMLPCPRCAHEGTEPVFMALDLTSDRYRCAVCRLDLPLKEIVDASQEVLEVL